MSEREQIRAAVNKAVGDLQTMEIGPDNLGDSAVRVQSIQAMFTGIIALQLIDLNTLMEDHGRTLMLVRNSISANGA